MQQVCGRCSRLSLLRESSARAVAGRSARRFSASTRYHDDDPVDSSMGIGSTAHQRSGSRPDDTTTRSPNRPPPQQMNRSPQQQDLRPSEQRFSMNRSEPLSGSLPRQQQSRPPAPGQVLQRVASRTGAPPPGRVLQRAPGRGNAPPPGLLIRRTAGPEGGSQGQNRFQGQRQGQRQGQSAGRRQGGQSEDKRKRRRTAQPDETGAEDMTTDEASAILDPPHNPTEPLPYTPKDMSLADLRADWPNTAVSPTGMVESVQQRIEFLARRIPHGYQTPNELAEHYQKGNLVRFESIEERDKVLELAKDLATKRADMLTERKSETVAADDMGFADLATSMENASLAAKMVRGVYPGLEKQRMPFMDNVVKALRNNETYHEVESEKFMGKIQSLLAQGTAGRAAQQQRTRS